MQVGSRQVFVSVTVVAGLFAPALSTASVASAPTPQSLTGRVEDVVVDQAHGRGTPDEIVKVLRVHDQTGQSGRVVPLTPDSLPNVASGSTVRVSVTPAGDGARRVTSFRMISAAAEPGTEPATLPRTVYIALVSPAGYGADLIQSPAATTAMVSSASSYWSSQTGGQVTFNVARVLPWYRSAHGCSDIWGIWNEALDRMPDAVGAGKHLIVVSPPAAYQSSGCPYGLGTIGTTDGSDGIGDLIFVSGQNQSLYSHELGHNMGLYHSNSLRCSGAQDMPAVDLAFPGCLASAYDDLFDVMGYSGPGFGEGSLNAVHLLGMSLLPNAVRTIAANSGVTTARITPLSTSTDHRTLKINDPSGPSYFAEYRTNSGRDSVAGSNPFRPAWGVRVLREDPRTPSSAGSYELDATPTSLAGTDYNRSIPVGGTFTSASRKLIIRVAAQDATGATLTITNWAAPIVPFSLTHSVPATAWVGSPITATTRVSDQYGRTVAGWPVFLQRMPRGSLAWLTMASLRTGSAGTASLRFTNGLSGAYRWVSGAATGAPSRLSPSAAVTSVARVVENRPAASTRYRSYLSVSGSVSAVPAPVVYLQYRVGSGPWRTAARAAVRGTAVSARMAMNVRAVVSTRLYARTATSYAGSVSGTYLTAVR